jgi:NTP pyrophosphatase (non-canonical NTP hydrolase)
MSLASYQKNVNDWVKQYTLGYFKPLEILARLAEEVGELARELNHQFGPKKKKPSEKENDVGDEIADIIFTLMCLANSLDIDLDKSFEKMMKKLKTRDRNRYKKKTYKHNGS